MTTTANTRSLRRASGRLTLLLLYAGFSLLGCHRRDVGRAFQPDLPTRQAGKPELPQQGYFEDVSANSGISFVYLNGEEAGLATILESLGGGVALLDYDGDGLLDIFLPGGGYFGGPGKKDIKGHPCKLYKNLGNFRFKDVTAAVGLDHLADGAPWFYTHGCAVADYDNDGWPDLLVTGYGRLALFHNVPDGKGGRRFEDVTRKAGLTDSLWSTSAAWADLDGDAFPDLYVCHYVNWSFANNPPCKDYRDQTQPDVCPPKVFQALPHALYRNNRNGTFTEVGAEAGLRVPRPEASYARLDYLSAKSREGLRRADQVKDYGKGLGVLIADLDGDGRPDIYVANDTSGNFLYLNRSGSKIRLEEAAAERGVAYDDTGTATGSMGIDAADYNDTRSLSLFVTNYQNEAHALYRNRGQGQFVFASRSAGIAAIGLDYVGFGTGFLDFDLDGHEDVFISNGHVVHHPPPPAEVTQLPVLLRNCCRSGDKPHEVAFENVSSGAGPYFQVPHLGRGAALGDLDNDGRIDIVLNPMNEPAVLLRNRCDSGHHWLGIQLVGSPYRDAVGARLELQVSGQTLLRTVKGGGSYLSSGDRRVVFGLGPRDRVGRLTVRWPSGLKESWEGLAVDRYWRLHEGEGQAERNGQKVPPISNAISSYSRLHNIGGLGFSNSVFCMNSLKVVVVRESSEGEKVNRVTMSRWVSEGSLSSCSSTIASRFSRDIPSNRLSITRTRMKPSCSDRNPPARNAVSNDLQPCAFPRCVWLPKPA
jgi:hypothetical protein